MNKQRQCAIFVALLFAFISLPAMSADERPSVESFFNDPTIGAAKLSPSGKYVALLTKASHGHYVLIVDDTDDPKKMKVAAVFDKFDILSADWVNDNRLIFRIRSLENDEARANWSVYAVNRDGSELTLLISGDWGYRQEATGSNIKRKVLTADYDYVDAVHDGSDDVIVARTHYSDITNDADNVRLFRLNTKTVTTSSMIEGDQPGNFHAFVLDMNQEVRIAHTFEKGRDIMNYQEPHSKEWKLIGNFDYLNNKGFTPRFFGDNNKLYVSAPYKKQTALYVYDLKEMTMAKEPFLTLDGFDFNGAPEIDYAKKKVLGIHYITDAANTVWFDPRFAELQKKVDAIFPQTINTITCGDCGTSQTLLISTVSDRQPKQYFVYNPTTGRVFGVGGRHSDIKPEQMGARDFYHYTARDGLSIPAYVTMPPQKADGPRPAIVLVHGGPNVRGSSWEWESEAQFLASRGYVVIQPEYRGSLGFGFQHFRAGWKQWGQTMQDDLADAAKWAIAKGWADPKRIAIAGASYGGYATLMGLIKNPEIFRCGVAWAAVTDIDLMFNSLRSDASEEALHYGMKTLVGDPKADADMFKANSPVANASRLTQPLLLAHGGEDRRAPVEHGKEFRDAINKDNKYFEWVEYIDEGHGWHHENNRIDFWKRVDLFLQKNLK